MGSEVQILPGPPPFWGRSSAGRAPALQAGGRRFEPDRLHKRIRCWWRFGSAKRRWSTDERRSGKGADQTDQGIASEDLLKQIFCLIPCYLRHLRNTLVLLFSIGAVPRGPVSSQRSKSLVASRTMRPWWMPYGRRDLCQGKSGSGASLGAPSVAGLTGKRHSPWRMLAARDRRHMCSEASWFVLARDGGGDHMCMLSSRLAVCGWVHVRDFGCGWLLCMVGRSRAREGHSVDALAPGGDEGRGTLRKAMGSREQALIRGYPNGATHSARSIAS